MKKIIRFSLVFALSCAALLNTGCTKDFENDLNAVRKDLQDFQNGTFQSVKDQVANLETQLGNLTKADETIKSSISALEKTVADLSKKVDASGSAADLAAVKADVATLKSTGAAIQKDIETIKKDIATLKTDKADKSWVSSTFATLADQKKIQENLAKVTADLATLSDDLSKLQTKEAEDVAKLNEAITDINNSLVQVTTIADEAKNLAGENYKWLGNLQAYVDGLYTNAQIDAKINELKGEAGTTYATKKELEDAKKEIEGRLSKIEEELLTKITLLDVNGEISKAKDDITKAYEDADKKLKEAYEAADAVLKDELQKAITEGDDTVVAKVERLIEANTVELKEWVEKYVTSVANFSERIEKIETALKDCATKEEVTGQVKLAVANCDANIAAAKTELEGKIAAVETKLAALADRVISISVLPMEVPEITPYVLGDTTSYKFNAQFLVRPASAAAGVKKDSLKIELKYGWAKGSESKKLQPIDSLTKLDVIGGVVIVETFFYDSEITKEVNTVPYYALTYKGGDANGTYSVTSDFVEAESYELTDLVADKGFKPVYSAAIGGFQSDYLTDTVSVEYTKIVEFSKTPFTGYEIKYSLGTEVLTAAQVTEKYGIPLDVDVCKTANPDTIFTVTYPTGENIVPFTVAGKSGDFSKSVNKVFDYGIDSIKVNGVKFDDSYALQTIKVTKISRHIYLDTLKFQWNWKNWAALKDTLSLNNNDWYGDGTFAEVASRPFDNLTITDETKSPLEFKLKEGKGWPTSVVNDSLVIGKNNASDSMTFHLPVNIYGAPVIDTVVRQANAKLVFALTAPDTIAVPLVTDVIAKAGGVKAFTKNLSGENADSVTLVNAFTAAVQRSYDLPYFIVKVNGELVEPLSVDITAESVQIEFEPNTFTYGNTYTVTIDAKSFGINYVYEYSFTADDAPYCLKTLPYIVDGKGEVRGKFVNKVYTLDQMYFAKYLRIFGKIPASDVSSVRVKIDTVTEHGTVEGANGNLEFSELYATLTIDIEDNPIAGTSNEFSLNQGAKASWNTYTGRKVTFKASLVVGDIEIGTPVEFTLWTAKPVQFMGFQDFVAKRLAATEAVFHLNEKANVYGVEEGVIKPLNLIKRVGNDYVFDPDRQYPGCKFVYRYDLMTCEVNGVPYTLVSGVDYIISDPEKDEIRIIGDNCVGDVKITVPVELQYYLDYSHVAVEKQYATILLNQN